MVFAHSDGSVVFGCDCGQFHPGVTLKEGVFALQAGMGKKQDRPFRELLSVSFTSSTFTFSDVDWTVLVLHFNRFCSIYEYPYS